MPQRAHDVASSEECEDGTMLPVEVENISNS
jgi:hypothetical protein